MRIFESAFRIDSKQFVVRLHTPARRGRAATRIDITMKPATKSQSSSTHGPLQNLEEWEDFLKERYPEPAPAGPPVAARPFQTIDPHKKKTEFRNYEADARPTVREFY